MPFPSSRPWPTGAAKGRLCNVRSPFRAVQRHCRGPVYPRTSLRDRSRSSARRSSRRSRETHRLPRSRRRGLTIGSHRFQPRQHGFEPRAAGSRACPYGGPTHDAETGDRLCARLGRSGTVSGHGLRVRGRFGASPVLSPVWLCPRKTIWHKVFVASSRERVHGLELRTDALAATGGLVTNEPEFDEV
jgi:hypothetical protein